LTRLFSAGHIRTISAATSNTMDACCLSAAQPYTSARSSPSAQVNGYGAGRQYPELQSMKRRGAGRRFGRKRQIHYDKRRNRGCGRQQSGHRNRRRQRRQYHHKRRNRDCGRQQSGRGHRRRGMRGRIPIPGKEELIIENAVFDFNGTLATDGKLPQAIKDMLISAAKNVNVFVLTSDPYGTAAHECEGLCAQVKVLEGDNVSLAKRKFVYRQGADRTVCIGNGTNDVGMFRICALSILVIGGGRLLCGPAHKKADVPQTNNGCRSHQPQRFGHMAPGALLSRIYFIWCKAKSQNAD